MRRDCSIANALGVVGDRWSLLVVRELLYGQHRFTEIQQGTGAPTDVLTARLRKLTAAGVIEARPYSSHPPRSEYHLTDSGFDLAGPLLMILRWGDRWVSQTPPIRFSHQLDDQQAHPARPALICAECGQPMDQGRLAAIDGHGHEVSVATG